jgi:uncharacterized protein YceH (UPF0502 family)
VDIVLSAVEARVLGALVEKDVTTPEYYPLSLNALVNACNQKSNREPVMNLDESEVRDALNGLQAHRLAGAAGGADGRVTKFEHRLQEVFNFDRRETAVLCVLLLRGPQTPGELRGRTERMYRFETLDDVQGALQKLMAREPALVKVLARAPGTKESRYAHLLGGEVEEVGPTLSQSAQKDGAVADGASDRAEIASVRTEVAELRKEVEGLKAAFAEFRKQFE